MIKPVKRNKRLKWIDSHYAINYIMDAFIDRKINETAADWGVPVHMILGKSVLHDVYDGLERLNNDKAS